MKLPNWELTQKLNCQLNEDFSDQLTIGLKTIHFKAVSAKLPEMEVTSAGVSECPITAEWKAFGELIERVVGVQKLRKPVSSDATFREAISNGMAAHSNLEICIMKSQKELIERDAILKSWNGFIRAPFVIGEYDQLFSAYGIQSYVSKNYIVAKTNYANKVFYTIAAFMFPLNDKLPICYGFGCEESVEQSVQTAVQEMVQRFVFLKDETDFSGEVDERYKNHPMYHQEFYLKNKNHHYLMSWLGENNVKIPEIEIKKKISTEILLNGEPLFVTKSTSDECMKLYFGNYPYTKGTFPTSSALHPIP